ncbi:hypothetical protein [Streptomyces sp. NPDC059071]|uniref:hypothetical protein n=1 Tax=unclassified Streptomyces TaxID=2593676 RepID=UPI0036525DCC
MITAARLNHTRALLDQPPPPSVPGQLTLAQAREAVPDGTFGDTQPPAEPTPRKPRPWTAQEQYEHRRALAEALDGWDWHDDYAEARRTRERQRYHNRTPAA